MRPYNVEIFTQDFEMVGNTNVNEITYKEVTLPLAGAVTFLCGLCTLSELSPYRIPYNISIPAQFTVIIQTVYLRQIKYLVCHLAEEYLNQVDP